MGKQYIAKIDNLYLQGKDTTSDIEEADIFESETEPRQRINQMKRDGKLNKKAKVTIKALESKNKLFKNVFKESADEMSLDEYCDSVNSDAKYIEAFKDWVKQGIHGRDILSRSRWDEIWDDFGGTFYDDEEEVEVSQFEVDIDAEKPLKVWKDGSRWKCSDGTTYMSYLKPADVVYWLRKDYGRAWLIESTNRKLRESNLRDSYNSILKDIKEYIFMCNDNENNFSGKKSFELSKRIFIENLSNTHMIHTKHIEEWFSEVEAELIKEGNSFWWTSKLEESKNRKNLKSRSSIKESKIKVLYDNLTDEIRNFILHDDEMDNFSGFDSYEFAKEEFFEKLSDKYMVTVDCIEELFSEIEYELAHEDEDIPFQESKKVSRKRIKEDSLDDPDVDLSQSFKGKDLETLRGFQNDSIEFFETVVSEELNEKGFSRCRFPKKDGYRIFQGGIFSKKVAEPGQNIYVTVEIGEYGKITANGVEYSADDLAKSLYEANKYYSMTDIYFTIDDVYQASIYGDSGQWIMRFKCKVPEDVLENYYK